MVIQDVTCLKEKAIEYFANGYACSEALIRAAYECGIIDKESDIELLNKIASPFAGGIKSSGCVCGALVGAQMTVGCLIGRKDISYPNTMLQKASRSLVEQFRQKGHITCCKPALDDLNERSEEKFQACSKIIEDVVDILYESILKDIKYTTLI